MAIRITKRFTGITEETYAQATDWRNEQLLKLGRGQIVEPSSLNLGEWLVEWLDVYKKSNLRKRSYERNISLIKHCKTLFEVKLQSITPHMISKLYIDELADYSGETRKKVHNMLNDALRQAFHNNMIYKIQWKASPHLK